VIRAAREECSGVEGAVDAMQALRGVSCDDAELDTEAAGQAAMAAMGGGGGGEDEGEVKEEGGGAVVAVTEAVAGGSARGRDALLVEEWLGNLGMEEVSDYT
jgi:hypothetical protein